MNKFLIEEFEKELNGKPNVKEKIRSINESLNTSPSDTTLRLLIYLLKYKYMNFENIITIYIMCINGDKENIDKMKILREQVDINYVDRCKKH